MFIFWIEGIDVFLWEIGMGIFINREVGKDAYNFGAILTVF
jgi:hypothetical protein